MTPKKAKGTRKDEFERTYDFSRSGGSVCEMERRSLFRPVHDSTNIGTGAEYLCQDAERRQCPRQDLAVTSAVGRSPEQATTIEYERTCGTGTFEEDRPYPKLLI